MLLPVSVTLRETLTVVRLRNFWL